MDKMAIVYARFGPYHVARLRAAYSNLGERGLRVIGIEVCPDDKFYAWDRVKARGDFRRIAVLPGRNYRDYTRRAIWRGVYETLEMESPDVVALPGWYFAEAVAGLRWCRRNGRIPILMSESFEKDERRVWWKEWFKRTRVKRFDAALVGGSLHAAYLMSLGMDEDRIFYGHNVVDNAYFRSKGDEARASGASFRRLFDLPNQYILASGRFIPRKNFLRLLQAYRLYCQQIGTNAFSLVLCGDGEQRGEIEAEIAAHSLEDRVMLPGFVQYDTLPIYYGLASFFVHPSTAEPWGLVVNEAMAAGLPVLVSDRCGCAPDLVDNGVNGFTFDPYNVDQLADRMVDLHQHLDALHDMGSASRSVISDWGPDRFAEGLWKSIQVAKR